MYKRRIVCVAGVNRWILKTIDKQDKQLYPTKKQMVNFLYLRFEKEIIITENAESIPNFLTFGQDRMRTTV